MKASVCPNCGSDQIDEKNYCPECDVQYNITAKEATPKKIGRMDQLEERVSKLEGDDINTSTQLPSVEDRPAAPGPADPVIDEDEDQDDNDFLPR